MTSFMFRLVLLWGSSQYPMDRRWWFQGQICSIEVPISIQTGIKGFRNEPWYCTQCKFLIYYLHMILLEKLTVPHTITKTPEFCGIQLSVPVLIQVSLVHAPQSSVIRYILILSCLCLDLPSSLLSFRFLHNNHVCISFHLHRCQMPNCNTHLILHGYSCLCVLWQVGTNMTEETCRLRQNVGNITTYQTVALRPRRL